MKIKSGMAWQTYLDKINPKTGVYFTEDESRIHVKSFRKNSKYYWIKQGFSEEDAQKKVLEFQRTQNKKSVKAVTGRTDVNPTQIGYWTKKGYDEKTAKEKISERQTTFSKSICIQKHGEVDGIKRWQQRQDVWQNSLSKLDLDKINSTKSLSIHEYIRRHGEIDGMDLYCKHRINKGSDSYLINRTRVIVTKSKDYESFNKVYDALFYKFNKRTGSASRESLTYFIPLYKLFRREYHIDRARIRVGMLGSKELCLRDKQRIYYYDFCCIDKKIIIEYNNVCWHPDPYVLTESEWNEWKHPFKSQTAAEKYLYDQKKKKFAEQNGYVVITIWNNKDYQTQLEYVINEIKNQP
jgi:very-short-patch-repair endonuclease